VPLLLVNMASGLLVLAHFIWRGLDSNDQTAWAPGFLITGVIALVFGFHMTTTWPLPAGYNVAFGELSVLFGGVFLGAAWATSKNWNLFPVTIYAVLAGVSAIVLGIRILVLHMTAMPLLTCIGFILTGSGGIFAFPALALKNNKTFRLAGVVVMVVAALIWAFCAMGGYWDHLQRFMERAARAA